MATFTPDDESGRERQPARKITLIRNSWRGLCIVIFVFGAVSFLQAHKRADSLRSGGQSVDVSDAEPARSYVVEYVSRDVRPDGTFTVTGTSTRYVKADGEWRLVVRRGTGRTSTAESLKEAGIYGGTPDGVFEKMSNSERRYVSPWWDQGTLRLYRSGNYLRNHIEFFRMDEVAGLNVYVFRVEVADPAYPGYWLETSYSPKTGITALRTVRHSSDGSEHRQEAVSVEFKDVPEELNNDLKTLPSRSKEKQVQ
ncbi:MAG TPA: hypothetical protein VLM38_00060 [Blastocatellia bacterium]|nr:hypothetical protein [Blastocatellia bacterium]